MPTTFTFATDLHGIEQDRASVKIFKASVDALKPKLKIFGGDLWNFAALRRGADEDEKSIRLKEDFDAGIEFLDWYSPDVFLLGNHDQRLWDAVKRERVRKSGWLAELADQYIDLFTKFAKAKGIRVLPYNKTQGVYRTNGVAFSHGFGSGATITTNMANAYGDVVFGHAHKFSVDTVMKGRTPRTGYGVGSLARKDMDYVRADLAALRQENGFAYGILGGKQNVILQARISNGVTTIAPQLQVIR